MVIHRIKVIMRSNFSVTQKVVTLVESGVYLTATGLETTRKIRGTNKSIKSYDLRKLVYF